MRLRTPPEDALDRTLSLSLSPLLGFSRSSFTEYKVCMDACEWIHVTRSIMSALILLPGES